MPEGWCIRRGPEEAVLEYNVDEGLWVAFETDSPYTVTVASHTVLRYDDLELAARVYDRYVSPSEYGGSKVPIGWTYSSPAADSYHVFCYIPPQRSQYHCQWSGLYAEYIAVFLAWLIPGRMTQQDFESIVEVIDRRMACILDDACSDRH